MAPRRWYERIAAALGKKQPGTGETLSETPPPSAVLSGSDEEPKPAAAPPAEEPSTEATKTQDQLAPKAPGAPPAEVNESPAPPQLTQADSPAKPPASVEPAFSGTSEQPPKMTPPGASATEGQTPGPARPALASPEASADAPPAKPDAVAPPAGAETAPGLLGSPLPRAEAGVPHVEILSNALGEASAGLDKACQLLSAQAKRMGRMADLLGDLHDLLREQGQAKNEHALLLERLDDHLKRSLDVQDRLAETLEQVAQPQTDPETARLGENIEQLAAAMSEFNSASAAAGEQMERLSDTLAEQDRRQRLLGLISLIVSGAAVVAVILLAIFH